MMPSKRRHRRLANILPLIAVIVVAVTANDPVAAPQREDGKGRRQRCERLPTSLTYSQDAVPADVSAILRMVVKKINCDVTGVIDVEVGWSGTELHCMVGERIVRCTVTRLAELTGDSLHGDYDGWDDENDASTSSTSAIVDEHGRKVVTQCFEVPFAVLDVDECTAPLTNPMVHRCPPPAVCVNTLGSYECACPSLALNSAFFYNAPITTGVGDGVIVPGGFWNDLDADAMGRPWDTSLGSSESSSCPGLPSTRGCCDDDGHSKEGGTCRSSFHCPIDPCIVESSNGGDNDDRTTACASNALCERAASPLSRPNFVCRCPPGLMGNGRPCGVGRRGKGPKVKYDGRTPTEELARALESGLICGCSEPMINPCDGFPKCPGKREICAVDPKTSIPHCTCQDGYVRDPDYGCVDENPPLLRLRPDPVHGLDPVTGITHLSQGDRYEEYGVDVIDDNAEEYLRSLKITYSRPLPQGCLLEMGAFTVNYTVATPWTVPNFARTTRTVVIDNIDECEGSGGALGASCPELVAMCDYDAGASCRDEIGTYTCVCPVGTEGDGYRPIPRLRPDGKGGYAGGTMVPRGYAGGTGCRDTSEPVIEILGPNPKRFRVARASGIRGIIRAGVNDVGSNARVEAMIAEQRSAYESDIRAIIKATAGAELCATRSYPNVRPTDCVHAEDHTYKGKVDLTSRVSVGEPVPKDGVGAQLDQWKVPYNVADDAGNKAKTVWRDIIIEEVDIEDFERMAMQDEVKIPKGEEDRSFAEAPMKERNESPLQQVCPPCDPCKCNNSQQKQHQRNGGDDGMLSSSECMVMCENKIVASEMARTSDKTCTQTVHQGGIGASDHQIIQQLLAFLEGLMGPSTMMLLFLGCFIATMVYLLQRVITTLFDSSGPHTRTYYHRKDQRSIGKEVFNNSQRWPWMRRSNHDV
ncbi:hypothetical protein ACHAXA_003298 [Cyclostephanos tholiformis]|uniref:EGF-like calcium-binding domain-containing protein n=1 Tax=Cyclostephanos tholiformis TaxID=382380 RepID=A0ABD3R6L2_9STRA